MLQVVPSQQVLAIVVAIGRPHNGVNVFGVFRSRIGSEVAQVGRRLMRHALAGSALI
jgi:hypothetical protein